MSDTQNYHGKRQTIFNTIMSFIAENRAALNIGYVVHTGDVVSKPRADRYALARAAFDILDGVPYGVLPGNHDQTDDPPGAMYSRYFPVSLFKESPFFGGAMDDGLSRYDLVTLGGTEFVFVYLAYPAGSRGRIEWANDVFRRYPERVGVLCTHEGLDSGTNFLASGKKVQEQVVRANRNVFITLCGHRNNEDTLITRFDDNGDGQPDRTVYNMIANYQYTKDGGAGFMRFLEFHEDEGFIYTYTYSPYTGAMRPIPPNAKTRTDRLAIPWSISK